MSESRARKSTENGLAPGEWSMLPTLARDTGALRQLTMAAARVYLALTMRANWGAGGLVIVRQAKLPEGESGASLEGDTGLTPET